MPKTDVKVKLVGEDGNAFVVMGTVAKAMKRALINKEIIEQYTKEAMSGDYNHLLRVTMDYVVVD